MCCDCDWYCRVLLKDCVLTSKSLTCTLPFHSVSTVWLFPFNHACCMLCMLVFSQFDELSSALRITICGWEWKPSDTNIYYEYVINRIMWSRYKCGGSDDGLRCQFSVTPQEILLSKWKTYNSKAILEQMRYQAKTEMLWYTISVCYMVFLL